MIFQLKSRGIFHKKCEGVYRHIRTYAPTFKISEFYLENFSWVFRADLAKTSIGQ
jgi:hypothetical protein